MKVSTASGASLRGRCSAHVDGWRAATLVLAGLARARLQRAAKAGPRRRHLHVVLHNARTRLRLPWTGLSSLPRLGEGIREVFHSAQFLLLQGFPEAGVDVAVPQNLCKSARAAEISPDGGAAMHQQECQIKDWSRKAGTRGLQLESTPT